MVMRLIGADSDSGKLPDIVLASVKSRMAPYVITPTGGDDTAALQAAVNAGDVILRGSFQLKTSLNIPSGRSLASDGSSTVTWTGSDTNSYFLELSNSTNVSVTGINWVGISNLQGVAHCTGGSYIVVSGNTATNTRLFVSRSSLGDGGSYANVTALSRAHHIEIANNKAYGSSKTVGFAAIEFQYTDDWSATDNTVENYAHGIQWWGGDANFSINGATANERKCLRGITHGNHVRNVAGGGVWGSMGENLTIGPDIVENCDDVGVDLEGCRNAVVYVGSVKNCKNGNLTTFFGSDNVEFIGGTSVQDNVTWLHFNTSNSTNDPTLTRSVSFRGVQFDTTTGVGRAGGASGPALLVSVVDCVFRNTRLALESENHRDVLLKGNLFQFTRAASAAFNVITVSRSVNEGEKVLSHNHVTTTIAQPAGTVGIKITESDPNTAPLVRVEQNQIVRSISLGLDANWGGTNAGAFLAARFFVRDNVWNGARITSTGAATAAVITQRDNTTRFAEALTVATS